MDEDLSRMTVVVETKFHHRFRKAISWGMRAKLVQIVLERMVDAIDAHGPVMIGAFLSGEFKIVFDPDLRTKHSVPISDTLGRHAPEEV